MQVDLRRADERFLTRGPGVRTRHAFSFGAHYDPAHTGFGPLVVHDDQLLDPGAGFDAHPHRDLEIVSWVVEGALLHEDSGGGHSTAAAGSVQRLFAGAGVVHSERCAVPTRFVQAWLLPDEPGGDVVHEVVDVDPWLLRDALVVVAGGEARVGLRRRGARLLVGRLGEGVSVLLPEAALRHTFLARGSAVLTGQPQGGQVVAELLEGDAALITGDGSLRLTARSECEVLLWLLAAV